jgi:hypothetical protein
VQNRARQLALFFLTISMPMLASIQDRLKRVEICHSCEHYRRSVKQCTICGCLVSLKITWANTRCPVDKWLEVEGGQDPISRFQQRLWKKFSKDPSQDQNKL